MFRASQKILGTGFRCKVAALNISPLDSYKYPREVKWKIDQNSKKDYINLAKEINNDPDISGVILQHEYGIFGGIEGEKVLFFMQNCKKPILVTLHTALPSPTIKMKEVTEQIIELASNIVVLTKSSQDVISKVYPNSVGKIFIIPHGIHPIPFSLQKEFKEKLELKNHIILSTFGLLSRGKGIEYVINALPELIKKYPSILYLILGETHPVIRRNEGEKYRLELAKLVTTLGLKKHVRFYDQYLDLSDLLEFLQATDIYVSTSINPNQAVSGTLSYALGSGRAVISTEFAQAKEVVTPNTGRLVPIKDSRAMTAAVIDLLSDRERLHKMSRNAYDVTRPMRWDNVALRYTNLLIRTIIPPINLLHLRAMTDDFGLFQFASHSLPNKDFGYTLDDNARALIVCCWLKKESDGKKLIPLIHVYFEFLKRCQKDTGLFTNYLGYKDKLPTEQNNKEDLEDTQSRALWALSEVINNKALPPKIKKDAREILLMYLNSEKKLTHIRAKALVIKSFVLILNTLPEYRDKLLPHIQTYTDSLMISLKEHSFKDWFWFEKNLKYNNAILSESLLIAGTYLNNSEISDKGLRSLQFLIEKTFSSNMYIPIGQSHWYENDATRSRYDQQPEDPASMISALSCAYGITHSERYKNLAKKCFSWFLGNNSNNKPLYDEKTGGCYDGLQPDQVNLNQGAESLVSYLMASNIVSKLH